MNDRFSWNGQRCTDFGIHISEQPPLTLPAERVTYASVPGRPGSLTTLEGDAAYDDMVLTATCFVSDATRINSIAAWLKGGGTVTFTNQQGGFYHARVVNQINFEKILRGNPQRSFAVNFRCSSFFYLADAQPIAVTVSGAVISNPGCVHAKPVIQVTLSGDTEITVGGFYFELTGLTGTVTDTPHMEAYQDYESRNVCMSGDYPTLLPGNNIITWTGGVTQMVIMLHWRTL